MMAITSGNTALTTQTKTNIGQTAASSMNPNLAVKKAPQMTKKAVKKLRKPKIMPLRAKTTITSPMGSLSIWF